MNASNDKKESVLRRWFRLCPVRHVLLLLGGILLGGYYLLRRDPQLIQQTSDRIVRPWHRWVARQCDHLPFSVAEALIVLGVLLAVGYIVFTVIKLIASRERGKRIYRFLLTCAAAFALIYGGFCMLWGVYYYSEDFEDQSGIRGEPVSVEQLTTVTRYFTDLVNQYENQVRRDENSCFAEPLDAVFDHAPSLYHEIEQTLPCLAGDDLSAKPFFFSRLMSYTNFTGFFFPFTGEANINVDVAPALIPSTIAHELAHQRGVAEEDEANFVAVLASLTDGDPVYCYSACLMSYIYLGNALYRADRDAWAENYKRLGDGVRADLAANSAYWAQFETPVSTISDSVYTGFLQSYGQTLGLQTYGKCVDLLIAYYYESALEAIK